MSTSWPYHVVDAFTTQPFSGNPAAVVVLEQDSSWPEDAILLNVAAEFNLSETAYVLATSEYTPETPVCELRWFTPTDEVPLCGHATLASAHVLFSSPASIPIKVSAAAQQIQFISRQSGDLIARREGDRISLDFPADMSVLDNVHTSGEDFELVKKAVEQAAPSLKGHVVAVARSDKLGTLVEVDTRASVEEAAFDPSFFTAEISKMLVVVTQPAPSKSSAEVASRVFGPLVGVHEDPVTGAAHTLVVPYWLRSAAAYSRLTGHESNASKSTLSCRQVSRRGGDLDCSLDVQGGRVKLVGSARTTMSGTLQF